MKTIKNKIGFFFFLLIYLSNSACSENELIEEEKTEVDFPTTVLPYTIVGTNQTIFYNNQSEIAAPAKGASFYGQDANYVGNEPSYTYNGDGTVTDNITGLMWQIDPGEKMTWQEASDGAENFDFARHSEEDKLHENLC